MTSREGMWGFGAAGMWSSNSPSTLRKWTRIGFWNTLAGAVAVTVLPLYGGQMPILGRGLPILPFAPDFSLLDFLVVWASLWTVFNGLVWLLNLGHWLALSSEDRASARVAVTATGDL